MQRPMSDCRVIIAVSFAQKGLICTTRNWDITVENVEKHGTQFRALWDTGENSSSRGQRTVYFNMKGSIN